MKKELKELLPLGTVVRLKDGEKKVMISGRIQQDERTHLIYDYCAVLWPEGMLDSESCFLFNNEDIGTLYYIGMQNEEEFHFRKVLEKALLEAQDIDY
jgi:hypothetical protein